LPRASEVSRELTSISNLLDLEDSRIALTEASLPLESDSRWGSAVMGIRPPAMQSQRADGRKRLEAFSELKHAPIV
jgi:hypothetical protein